MPDLLSAASLLLAVIAILYGLWYPDLNRALSTDVPKFKEDRAPGRTIVAEAIGTKSRPLVFASVAMALVFLPDAARVLLNSIRTLLEKGLGAAVLYDAVQTSLVLVEIVLVGLAVHLVTTHRRLRALLKSLSRST